MADLITSNISLLLGDWCNLQAVYLGNQRQALILGSLMNCGSTLPYISHFRDEIVRLVGQLIALILTAKLETTKHAKNVIGKNT